MAPDPRLSAQEGQRFSSWVVISLLRITRISQGRERTERGCLCRCDCSTEREVLLHDLTSGSSKSCGCLTPRSGDRSPSHRHGGRGTRVYQIWSNMRDRCSNSRSKQFHNYGGRGIRVCERWQDFANFRGDMGDPPSPKHSLDRIDNDGNYEPGNCRWATAREQRLNSRRVNYITLDGETLCLQDWCRRLGLNYSTASDRLKRGWPHERILGAGRPE